MRLTTSCANAHVACDFGHHAILLDVKPNFAKRGTPIQSQNSHGSSLIVVFEKSSAGQQHADTAYPLTLLRARRERPRDGCAAEKRNETRVSSIDRTAFGPRSQAGWEGYRIGMDQSAAIRIRL